MYILICDVKDLPLDIPMDTNPRMQNENTRVAKKIQASLTNHTERNFYLLNRGLIEGEAPNYTISLGIAKATRQLQGYTKQKGLDKEKIKQMILQYLKNAGTDGAKRDSIYEYVKDVMPQVKTHEQQLRLLGDILSALSTDKLIYPKGRTWFLKE